METPTRKVLFDYLGTILLAACAALLIRIFVLEAYRIPSFAMQPSLLPGDFIFVEKWPYLKKGKHVPARGEIVVFTQESDGSVDYIKRVVGIPGDIVELRAGVVRLNGSALGTRTATPCWKETLPAGKAYSACSDPESPSLEDFPATRISDGSVFVIGDLRAQGTPEQRRAQRAWGLVPLATIKGKATWVWLSVEHQNGTHIRWSRMFRRIE